VTQMVTACPLEKGGPSRALDSVKAGRDFIHLKQSVQMRPDRNTAGHAQNMNNHSNRLGSWFHENSSAIRAGGFKDFEQSGTSATAIPRPRS